MGELCPEKTEDGLCCQKQLYKLPSGEYIDHAGGHIFSTPEVMTKVLDGHYDAGAMLAGESVNVHMPDECPGDETCWTVRMRLT